MGLCIIIKETQAPNFLSSDPHFVTSVLKVTCGTTVWLLELQKFSLPFRQEEGRMSKQALC